MPRNPFDYTGFKRGRLKVIKYDDDKKEWLCKCDCGNTAYFTQKQLTSNKPSTCGNCANRLDLRGVRFGRLVALEMVEEKGKRNLWKCRCDCGNIVVTSTMLLRAGKKKSCGCLPVDNGRRLGTITKNHCYEGSDPYKLVGNKPRSNNVSGYRGVYLDKRLNKYTGEAWFKGKKHYIGIYDTPEEAHEAYLKKREELVNDYLDSIKENNPEEWEKIKKSIK